MSADSYIGTMRLLAAILPFVIGQYARGSYWPLLKIPRWPARNLYGGMPVHFWYSRFKRSDPVVWDVPGQRL